MKRLLIVDDEAGPRESIKAIFKGLYATRLADGGAAALDLLGRESFDLVMLDIMMPGQDGVTVLKEIVNRYPGLPVIMITALTAVSQVVEAIREGACDYLTKPFEIEEVRATVRRALRESTLRRRVEAAETEVARAFPLDGMLGESASFRHAREEALKAAAVDATVLIRGESGTGKELLARMIHDRGDRREEPFVAVHCAALPESLMESELFGYEKGAFTSADKRKPGRFDLAGSGTLFLDEIGEMSPATQVKLLRVLQEREYMRVGGVHTVRTNARIIAATARDLRGEVSAGRFRDDLFFRVNVVPIELPPLRERREDIEPLALYFFEQFKRRLDMPVERFDEEALALLKRYAWPGNIRELRNVIERLVVLHGRERVLPAAHLPPELHEAALSSGSGDASLAAWAKLPLAEAVNAFEKALVKNALRRADGVQTRAAKLLGTTRRILRYRMDKLQIDSGTNTM